MVQCRLVAPFGDGEGQVSWALGVCESTTSPGHIVVCDTNAHCIKEFQLPNVTDGSTQLIEGEGAPHCRVVMQFTDGTCPEGITPCGNDYIITDFGDIKSAHHRVMRISSGRVVWTAGRTFDEHDSLSDSNRFHWPCDAKMLLDGRVVVADNMNNRLQVLDAATGEILQHLG